MMELFEPELIAFESSAWWLLFLIKSSAILLFALALDHLFRKRLSASIRHSTLLAGFTALLCFFTGALIREVSPFGLSFPIMTMTAPEEQSLDLVPSDPVEKIISAPEGPASLQPSHSQSPAAPSSIPIIDTIKPQNPTEKGKAPISLYTIWLTGFLLIFCFHWVTAFRGIRRLVRSSSPASAKLLLEVGATTSELGLENRPRVRIGSKIMSPLVFGIFFPTVVLPPGFASMKKDERRLILLHELHHIRRRDVGVRYCVRILLSLFWFNPLSWIAGHRLVQLQELACDEAVLGSNNEAEQYADLLVSVARGSRNLHKSGVIPMASSSQLSERITAILREKTFPTRLHPLARVALAAFCIASIIVGLAQVTQVVAESQAIAGATGPTVLTAEERRHLEGIFQMFQRGNEYPAGLHYTGKVQQSGWRDSSNQLERFPVPKRFSVWLDGNWEAPMYRADLEPNVSMWTNGTAPWWIRDETEFSSGEDKRTIEHRDIGKRNPEIYRSGIENIPAIFAVLSIANRPQSQTSVEEGRSSSIVRQIESVLKTQELHSEHIAIQIERNDSEFRGESVVELILSYQGRKETWWFDPTRNYALRGWIREDLNENSSRFRNELRVFELLPLGNGNWFPRKATASLDCSFEARTPPVRYWTHEFEFETVEILDQIDTSFFTMEGIEESLNNRKEPPLPKTKLVGGTVVDESNNPVAGVEVSLLVALRDSKQTSILSTTDKEGRWAATLPEIHRNDFSLSVSHPDYAEDRYPRNFRERTSQPYSTLFDRTAKVVIKRGSTFSGKVIDYKGSAVANAEIVMVRDRWGANITDVRTNLEGDFTMPLFDLEQMLDPQIYLTVQAKGHGPALRIIDPKSLAENPQLVVALPPPSLLQLRIVDTAGTPVSGALVVADSWREETRTLVFEQRSNSNGLVHWDNAPNDAMSFDILGPKTTLRDCWVNPSDEVVKIVLRPAFSIQGTVVDKKDRASIRDFKVTLGRKTKSTDRGIYWEENGATIHQGGRFTRLGEHLGFIYSFRIEAEGYRPFTTEEFEAQRTDANVEILLERL